MAVDMRRDEILSEMASLADPKAIEGMARYGVTVEKSYGLSAPRLHAMAKRLGKNHDLAQALWESGVHDARLLSCMIDDPRQVTEEQMERWVSDFDAWDTCDCCCGYLFDKTSFAYRKAVEWSARDEEYVKRAGFALIAFLAVHDKRAADEQFLQFLPIIRREAADGRNFVKKAVNWALRSIGKRNASLNRAAVETAGEIRATGAKHAAWVASDALRELTGEAVQARLRKQEGRAG
jgi:3-methyladenine DNA glycosylase AlkD